MFENIISKNLNADAQESAAENSEAATATTTAPVEEAIATKPAYAPATPHDDFDWSVDRRNVTSYSAEERRSITRCMTTLLYSLMMDK